MVVISSGSDMMCWSNRAKINPRAKPQKCNLLHFLSYPDLGQGSLYAVAGDDHAVPLVSAPALKELSGEAALHHTRRRHHHAGTDVIKVIHALEESDT